MHAVSSRIPLVAGALMLLVGCYSNNGGLLYVDGGFGGGSPIGPDGGLDGASTAGDPRLAVDANGSVMAVFPVGSDVRANSFESTDGWGEDQQIDNERNAPDGVQVALAPGGDGWAVWTQAPNGLQYNFGNTFVAGSWSEAGKVEDGNLGSTFEPQLAIDAAGNVLFIWRKASGLQSQVWANRWDATENELTEPERLDSTGTAGAPAVASDPHGNGTAVWLQSAVAGVPPLRIVAKRYSPSNGWSKQEILAEGDITLVSGPRVAMDADGNAVVAYTQLADTWARTYSAGVWQPAARLSPDEGLAGAHQPSVAMDPDGRAVVVWREGPDILASAFY
jgi:hypothetical protein